MNYGRIRNRRTGAILADTVGKADQFWTRLTGLMTKKFLAPGEGLWIVPCRQIHMFGMKIPLSVWFVDKEGVICHIIDEITPGKTSPRVKAAYSVLEFPSGWAQQMGVKVGDTIHWEAI